MIPKLLHWIWLGDSEPSDFLKACRQSVLSLHPSWASFVHTSNAVLSDSAFDAIRTDLLAFYDLCGTCDGCHSPLAVQADLLRLCLLYVYGGIYLDYDMYAVQPLDGFLSVKPLLLGDIREGSLTAEAIIATEPNNPLIWELLQRFMRQRPVSDPDLPKSFNNVTMSLAAFVDDKGLRPYPPEYFIPHQRYAKPEQRYAYTDRTHLIHCWHREFDYDLGRLAAIQKELCGRKGNK